MEYVLHESAEAAMAAMVREGRRGGEGPRAYRVRSGVYRSGRTWCEGGDAPMMDEAIAERGVLLVWPEDCPWDIEDFPLPGTWVEVEVEKRNFKGRIMVLGPPRYSAAGKRWMIPAERNDGTLGYQSCKYIPSIWNARREVKPEREKYIVRIMRELHDACRSDEGRKIAERLCEIVKREEG